jgi:hypothetical protein
LFVGELMYYLRYLYLFAYVLVSNTFCVVFLLCLSSSCVFYVAGFSGFSFSDCSNVYFMHPVNIINST